MTATAGPTGTDATEAGGQSLATGAVGPAILAIERALNGTGNWTTAHHGVTRVTSSPIDAGSHTGLYHGAPAVFLMLNAATSDGRDRYAAARQSLAHHVRRLARRRLTAAEARLQRRQSGTFAEYDIFQGLVGIGALLLRHLPDTDELGDLLTYVTRLTQPRVHDEQRRPGWWVDHDPDPTLPTPGGHANLGMAHGAAGLLSLLALADRAGHQVNGQTEAIERLSVWFDRWRQDDAAQGPWWPQWLTRDQLRTGRPTQVGPGRPSWCYGAPGIARALQLAAIATNHATRRADAEAVLAACLNDQQLDRLTEPGICHGLAGLYHTALRAAADAKTPDIAARLPALAERLTGNEPTQGDGFLTGRTGHLLAMETARTAAPPQTRWDTCLLIN
ncbi:lanthionine synthetase C family protein [Micromonospora rubida]